MKVTITIKNARKEYDGVVVIPDLNLKINEGEFFTLLGPSGCGKTTLLRMIAGFNSIEGGDFYFNDTRINDLAPAKRNIGMVFQNYAIFPHMTVKQNVEFGLKNRKVPNAEMNETVAKFLDLMQIEQFKDRMPNQMSGGQQQRVALARALAISPDVLLMDEPLSNLDAKLRIEMREAIKDIQNHVGITTVYVTHDQEEAMAVSDRIAIMNAGIIQQIGTPRELYQRPGNIFVATFVGRTNILEGKIENKKIVFKNGYTIENDNLQDTSDQKVQISVRPEEFIMHHENLSNEGIDAVVNRSTFLGLMTHYFITLSSGEQIQVVRESALGKDFRDGEKIKLTVKKEKINIFRDDKNSTSLMKTEVLDD